MGSTLQFGIACFFVLFGLSQLFQWMQHLSLPLPIFILGGAFLAIASNFDKRAGLPFSLIDQALAAPPKEATKPESPKPEEATQPQLAQSSQPVSFTIRKPEQ